VAKKAVREKAPEDPAVRAAAAQARENAAKKTAEQAARSVFAVTPGSCEECTACTGTRPPTAEERTAARVLARALSNGGVRDRVAVKTTSIMPPGRLWMRGALAADA
jgi:predicted metal-binding protein